MRRHSLLILLALAACATAPRAWPPTNGTLLLIGGGLDDDSAAVYGRFLALAGAHAAPRIVVMTAATGPQDQESIDKTEALRTWRPGIVVETVWRETTTAASVAAIDAATALFFTGGDQQRITARYRPGGAETPEWLAMQRLLARGGVIAGASAGCAMMGRRMLEGGSSAQALGVPAKATTAPPAAAAADAAPAPLGPRLGDGMAFLPVGLTDSHFFERDRLGRLVAALAASGERWGYGVGEDAGVEVDLATGELHCVSASEALLVDAAGARRDGAAWTGLRARVLRQGERFVLPTAVGVPSDVPHAVQHEVPVAEPGQNRQLASWRLFRQAAVVGSGVWRLRCEGWSVRAVADADGWVAFAIDLDGRDERAASLRHDLRGANAGPRLAVAEVRLGSRDLL